jgi:hypothetical protein
MSEIFGTADDYGAGLESLARAQSDPTFTGDSEPLFFPGTNILRKPKPPPKLVEYTLPQVLGGLGSFIGYDRKKGIGENIADMITPGRKSPLGVLSLFAPEKVAPQISLLNSAIGAYINAQRNVNLQEQEAEKDRTPTREEQIRGSITPTYDEFGNPSFGASPEVKVEKLDPFGEGDFPTVKGAYSQPQFNFDPNVNVAPMDEFGFDAMGMRNQRYAFDMLDPAFDARDFDAGGTFSSLGLDRSGNIRREVDADGNVRLIDVGI